ncbi:MAG TPA: extradiol ring-cleavage dioxygenase [Lachnospiraceae bacterium]|nr:extradiol ring-cleavage dioxygenase [Lachnospiraceae bacterium]
MGILAGFMVPHPPLIIPDIGRGEERAIQDTIEAYKKAAQELAALEPETVVLLSPHQTMYADYFHISPGRSARGDFGQFGAKQVCMEVSYDMEFVKYLGGLAGTHNLHAGTLGEREKKLDHGTMVPLYFVNQFYTEYRLVRIGLSGFPLAAHYRLGQCIREVSDMLGRKTVIIASGDLSHRLKKDGPYGYRKEGPEYDARIMDVMGRGDFGELLSFQEDFCEKAAECGHRSFTVMAGAFDKTVVDTERLSYEGPFGVGYGICTYHAKGTDEKRNFLERYEAEERQRLLARQEKEDAYVKLARHTIETFVRTGKQPQVPEGLPDELYRQRAGAFVSLKEDGKLRGCIGTISAVRGSLAEEIVHNAVSACSDDPRFSPVEQWEVERLTISVDVLGDAERITSPAELDVARYGVIVTKGGRRGLLLPNLEGIDTVEQQIAIAKQKAGIQEHEAVELERFEVVRHY